MAANCLTRALDQWSETPEEYRLWYNSNHVISLEGEYEGSDLSKLKSYPCLEYSPLQDYGLSYFKAAFKLDEKYIELLTEYLRQE